MHICRKRVRERNWNGINILSSNRGRLIVIETWRKFIKI